MQTQILNKIQFALFELCFSLLFSPLSLSLPLSIYTCCCCCCSFNLKMLENNASWQRGNSRPMQGVGGGAGLTSRATKQQPKCWHAKCVINNFVCTFSANTEKERESEREREREIELESEKQIERQASVCVCCAKLMQFQFEFYFVRCIPHVPLARHSPPGLRSSLSHSMDGQIVVFSSTNISWTIQRGRGRGKGWVREQHSMLYCS